MMAVECHWEVSGERDDEISLLKQTWISLLDLWEVQLLAQISGKFQRRTIFGHAWLPVPPDSPSHLLVVLYTRSQMQNSIFLL